MADLAATARRRSQGKTLAVTQSPLYPELPRCRGTAGQTSVPARHGCAAPGWGEHHADLGMATPDLVDRAFDLEQRINAPDRLQRHRRDHVYSSKFMRLSSSSSTLRITRSR